jgi:uncharacterized protein HemX
MGAAILSLLGPLLGPILAVIAALAAFAAFYFGIKRKGVLQEREKQEAQRIQEVAKVQAKVQEATSKDTEIDTKVANEIEQIKTDVGKQPTSDKPDIFRF